MSALYAVAFLSSLGFSIVVPFMAPLVLELGGNAVVVGVLGALFWSAQLVGSSLLGQLSDRVGRKRVLLVSQLGAMAAWLLFLGALSAPRVQLIGIAVPLLFIAAARITDGLFNGSVSVANAYVADVADGDRRKLYYGRLGAASSLGFAVGPMLSGFIARGDAGMRVVVVLALLFSASAALLIKLRLPALPPRPGAAVEVARTGGVHAHKALGGGCPEAVSHARWHVRAILAIPELRPLIALYFLVYLAFSMFAAALPLHAILDVGLSIPMLGVLYATLALALGATEALVLPPLARRLAPPVIAAAGSAILIAAYLALSISAPPALLAGGVLYGVGNGLMWPSYLTMLSHAGPPEAQGTVQGVGSSTGSLASIIGTVTGGVIYVVAGAATFYVSAAAVAIATAMFIGYVRGRRSSVAA